ncbi:MAG: undecaprenyl-diphosphate phosphatase [Meiothermus sp.]|uniref:undecaprenyl-diphosphate phosphatase n=1 Tax=Meiothermus sp. TaxID=1955249 RepID=UPI0025D8C161|nr:undecaprenyl-diphosphate phosphatase [Meiothermus sp.]MCS7057872.1 undecaprenyl-diphosphate phosphatase [Meiothermus sp.]MCS7194252.1 undecaprenyl-diphosphate phosphatase [Meiothermus sp.]MCX7739530.1 undecaprenyl-diphosphate phosphatase [Meiothermus sp.]MDW8090814.1 undecaprenyl-diphosphate phosphatase [Meiothermus sp.]MDW8480764.1 undecaprenyl-diphosphate phosphatase [Meiothermus sp.]
MTVFEALILGVLEGLTEFLPISSTGHLTLAAHLLGLDIQNDPFIKSFVVVIQLGAILAVLTLYFRRFLRDLEVWKRVLLAFIPTGVLGFLFADVIERVFLGNDLVVVVNLVGVGVLLLLVDRSLERRKRYEDVNQMPPLKSVLVGLAQALAMMPGVSRSGATIVGGMALGMSRRAAAEFSFILAVPTMLSATGFSLLRHLEEFRTDGWALLAVGFLAAFFTALLTVRWLLSFVSQSSFVPFAIYRILVGVVYGVFFLR